MLNFRDNETHPYKHLPLINCLMVLPREILAINIPTKGDQEIHQPQ